MMPGIMLMASKVPCRNYVKDRNLKQNAKSAQNELPDEIALRDEIFQLKRQIMLLKKANERNVIKVRKYEDEAKKKDRQIEQLMDPVKNGDVRKLLSTKGAALLLNLKEQNNTLIQMILDKDVQIRKLLSEIKTSKLYAGRRKTESYRSEIDRLRNLLIKSQNMMKETQDIPQRRSICVGGTPALEMTLSSDLSSPRDLEELQFTIQSLEMHMKYSNELLAKKNEQIMKLTERLNAYQCSLCRKNLESKYLIEPPSSSRFTESQIDEVTPNSTILFDKNVGNKGPIDRKRLPSSAPAGPSRTHQEFKVESSPTCQTSGKDEEESDVDKNISQFIKSDGTEELSCGNSQKTGRRGSPTDDSEIDTAEFEMMERKIESDQIEIESPAKLTPPPPQRTEDAANGDGDDMEEGAEIHPADIWNVLEAERNVGEFCDGENNSVDTSVCIYEEEACKSLGDFYDRVVESSFDSDSTTASVHEVEVEAEINHTSLTNSEQKDEDFVVITEVIDDDDDDVIIR